MSASGNKVKLLNNDVILKRTSFSKFVAANIKIPDFQRDLNKQKVTEIVEYQNQFFKKHNMYQFSTPITLCLLDSEYYVADGQHRYYAMKELLNKNKIDFEILLSINEMSTMEEMKEFFIIINKGSSVSDWHLHSLINKDPKFLIYKNIQEYITINYKNFISQAKRPQKPNINPDDFCNYLTEIKYFDDCDTKEEAIEKIEQTNQSHYQELLDDPSVCHLLDKCFSKKNKNGECFFLGINWMYKEKVKISQAVRQVVWNQHAGEGVGSIKCQVCEVNTITPFTFEAGHIKARAVGGLTVPKNLRPVCKSCNNAMGVQSLHEYKRTSF